MTKKPQDKVGIGDIWGSSKASVKAFNADTKRRKQAEAKILKDTDLFNEYGLSKELSTTLNGEYRPITTEDLATFRRRVGVVRSRSTKNQIKGGITPQQVIAFAKPSPNIIGAPQKAGKTDIDRANEQIKMCVLAGANKGKLRFITNASGETKGVYRHYVNVSLQAYGEAKAMPKDPKKPIAMGKWLSNQPIKFECDCGRHTFWFRYIASIGGWAEGRIENGYPKERNAKLIGVACKHVLRVMREMTSSTNIHRKVGQMLLSDSPIRTKQAEAERQVKNQKRKPKQIDQTSAKKAIALLKKKVARKAKVVSTERKTSKGANAAKSEAIRKVKALHASGVITDSDMKTILEGMK